MSKKLYEIQMKAFKVFYVEADSQEAALNSAAVDDESSVRGGGIDWEHGETRAEAVTSDRAESIRKHRPNEIASDDGANAELRNDHAKT